MRSVRFLKACAVLALLSSPAAAADFAVRAVYPFGPSHVAVAFTDSVDIASALLASHYVLTPQSAAPPLRGRGGGLFVSGIRATFDLSRPDGDRIVELEVAGAPLDTARVYVVATTNYLAEGNSGLDRLRTLPPGAVDAAGFTDREVLERYLRAHDPLRPANDGRWQPIARP